MKLRPLVVVIGALAGLLYWEVSEPGPATANPSPPGRATPNPVVRETFVMPPPAAFQESLDRPVFSPTRRPLAEAPIAAASATPTRLVGIVLTETRRIALVETGQPPVIQRVAEGSRVGNWMIEQILPDRIIVSNAGGRVEIKPQLPDAKPRKLPASRS